MDKRGIGWRSGVLVFCLSWLVLGAQPAATGDEPDPTRWSVDFYGEQSTVAGHLVPVGAVIRAYDPDGVLAGRSEVVLEGWYLMAVYGDDPETALDEGAELGDTITFTIDGQAAATQGPDLPVWDSALTRLHVELESGKSLFGDVDGDCDVDLQDVGLVAGVWRCVYGEDGYEARYDLNNDGRIDVVDIMQVVAHWGEVCPP